MTTDLALPPALEHFVTNLTRMNLDLAGDIERESLPGWSPLNDALPSDPLNAWICRAAGITTQMADRAADLRAVLTAYSQAIAAKRPDLTLLARWQRISPSALRHRYSPVHVQAITELLSDDPLIDIVLEPLPSVRDEDFRGISPELDRQVDLRMRMRAAAIAEFNETFGDEMIERFGFARNFAEAAAIGPIADVGSMMIHALQAREPSLLPVYLEWRDRYDARPVHAEMEARRRRERRNN